MYSVTPVQYTSGAVVLAYMLVAIFIAFFIFWLVSDKSDVMGVSVGVLVIMLAATIGTATYLFYHSSSLYVNDDNYDAIAVGDQSWLSIKQSYVTARGVSQAAGRPVGTASTMDYADDALKDDSRPVSYLADDGYIRQGTVKFDRSGSLWAATLYDLDGKPVRRPSRGIGESSAMSMSGDDNMKFVLRRSRNGNIGGKDEIVPTIATLQASGGSTVRITSGNGGLSMDDGKNPAQPVRLTILDGKAYATAAGSHDGKPITVGDSGSLPAD